MPQPCYRLIRAFHGAQPQCALQASASVHYLDCPQELESAVALEQASAVAYPFHHLATCNSKESDTQVGHHGESLACNFPCSQPNAHLFRSTACPRLCNTWTPYNHLKMIRNRHHEVNHYFRVVPPRPNR